MKYHAIKKKLFNLCKEYVSKRIATAKNAMDVAQSGASEESKTSMGDWASIFYVSTNLAKSILFRGFENADAEVVLTSLITRSSLLSIESKV